MLVGASYSDHFLALESEVSGVDVCAEQVNECSKVRNAIDVGPRRIDNPSSQSYSPPCGLFPCHRKLSNLSLPFDLFTVSFGPPKGPPTLVNGQINISSERGH
jgi:hypothetical protein